MAIIRNRILEKLTLDSLSETAMRAELLAAKRRLMPDLPDENDGSVIMRLIDLFIVHAQKWLRLYGESIINESFLATAALYESVYLRALELGYIPRQEIPATTTLTLTLNRTLTSGLIMLKSAYIFKTQNENSEDQIAFEMVADNLIIPAGTAAGTNISLPVIQGTTITGESLGFSDGEMFQEFETAQGYVCANGIKVYVDGVEWTKVDNMLLSDYDDNVYEILRYTSDGHVIIGFGSGDGVSSGHGTVPDKDAEITIDYRILPGGQNGNVAANTITLMSPATSLLSVTNSSAATGWIARETIDDIRWNAKHNAELKDGVIIETQYVTEAEKIDGIGRAYAVVGEFGENTIGIHCTTESGGTPTQTLLDSVESTLEDLNPGDERVKALKALYSTFNVSATIWALDGYDIGTVMTAIETALNNYFNPTNTDSAGNRTVTPGMTVYVNTLIRIMSNVTGVDRIELTLPATAVTSLSNRLPKLNEIRLTAGLIPEDD